MSSSRPRPRPRNGPGPFADNRPSASVVICAYAPERWDQMERAVASVEAQDHPPSEIIVVIDHNEILLARARNRWPEHTVVGNTEDRGLSGARNTGTAHARGDVIVFLDDDAEADRSWLGRMTLPFVDQNVGAVGGRVQPRWVTGRPRWFPDEFLWVVGCSYRGLPQGPAPVRNPIGASMAIRAEALASCGGFRSEVGRIGTNPVGGEETEFCIRMASTGLGVRYDPGAEVGHDVGPERTTWTYFWRRCLAEGRSKAAIAQLAAPRQALSSEWSYITRTLPLAVGRALWQIVRGPDRVGGVGRAAAIVAGLAVTAIGYAEGRIRGRSTAW